MAKGPKTDMPGTPGRTDATTTAPGDDRGAKTAKPRARKAPSSDSGSGQKPKSSRADRTREKFIEQVSDLILAEGISVLTIGEIAARMQCSRRRIYQVAATKEELLFVVSRNMFDTALEQGHAASRREVDLIKGISAYLNVGTMAAGRLSVAYLTDLDSTREGRKLWDKFQIARAEGLEQLISDGVRRGLFDPHNARVAAEALLGAALRLRRPRFLAEVGLTMEMAFQDLYALFLNGLLPRNKRKPRSAGGTSDGHPLEEARARDATRAADQGEALHRIIEGMIDR